MDGVEVGRGEHGVVAYVVGVDEHATGAAMDPHPLPFFSAPLWNNILVASARNWSKRAQPSVLNCRMHGFQITL